MLLSRISAVLNPRELGHLEGELRAGGRAQQVQHRQRAEHRRDCAEKDIQPQPRRLKTVKRLLVPLAVAAAIARGHIPFADPAPLRTRGRLQLRHSVLL
jgi:uncharacterized membrane protein YebE (DUF533 family)